MRYIRVATSDLPRDTARAALSQARRISQTDARPTLTQPNREGFYYAVIDDEKQLKLFVGFLDDKSVRHSNLSSPLPHEKIIPRGPTAGTTQVTAHIDELLRDTSKMYDDLQRNWT